MAQGFPVLEIREQDGVERPRLVVGLFDLEAGGLGVCLHYGDSGNHCLYCRRWWDQLGGAFEGKPASTLSGPRQMTYRTDRYHLGPSSAVRLDTCHPILIHVVKRAISRTPMDFSVECGFRGKASQDMAFNSVPQRSTKKFPESEHNHLSDPRDVAEDFAHVQGVPMSMAVDLVPYLYGKKAWDREEEMRWLNGYVLGVGMEYCLDRGFYLRSGVDWDMDGDQREHSLVDSPHLELRRLS